MKTSTCCFYHYNRHVQTANKKFSNLFYGIKNKSYIKRFNKKLKPEDKSKELGIK